MVIDRSGASYYAFSFLFRFLFLLFFIELRLLSISGLGGFANSSIAGILEKLAPLPLARQFRHLQQDGLSGHHYKKEKKTPRVKTGGGGVRQSFIPGGSAPRSNP